MEEDKDLERTPDFNSFKITSEVRNTEFKTNKDDETTQLDVFDGSGYLLFVTQSDGVVSAMHGYNDTRSVMNSMVEAASNINALPILISETFEKIVEEGKVDAAMKYLQGVAHLKGWGKVWQII